MEATSTDKNEVIKREIILNLSPGINPEFDYNTSYSSRFILSLYEENNELGFILLDSTRHFYMYDSYKENIFSNFRTLLISTNPVEILIPNNF